LENLIVCSKNKDKFTFYSIIVKILLKKNKIIFKT
jgi:hypothetical protein